MQSTKLLRCQHSFYRYGLLALCDGTLGIQRTFDKLRPVMIHLEKKGLLRKNESRLDYHMKSGTNVCIIFALGPKILMKILITRSV